MSENPNDAVFMRVLALETVLRHVKIKVAKDSGHDRAVWMKELSDEIALVRDAVAEAADSPESASHCREVHKGVEKFMRGFAKG